MREPNKITFEELETYIKKRIQKNKNLDLENSSLEKEVKFFIFSNEPESKYYFDGANFYVNGTIFKPPENSLIGIKNKRNVIETIFFSFQKATNVEKQIILFSNQNNLSLRLVKCQHRSHLLENIFTLPISANDIIFENHRNISFSGKKFQLISDGFYELYIKIFGTFFTPSLTKIKYITLSLFSDLHLEDIDKANLHIPITVGNDYFLPDYRLKGKAIIKGYRGNSYRFVITCIQDPTGVPLTANNNEYYVIYDIKKLGGSNEHYNYKA